MLLYAALLFVESTKLLALHNAFVGVVVVVGGVDGNSFGGLYCERAAGVSQPASITARLFVRSIYWCVLKYLSHRNYLTFSPHINSYSNNSRMHAREHDMHMISNFIDLVRHVCAHILNYIVNVKLT